MSSFPLRPLRLLVGAVLLAACGGSDGGGGGTVTPPPSVGGFTIALSQSTLSVQQGQSGSVTASITRTGSFTGTVDLSTENVPAGITATFSPASVTSTTTATTLSVTVGATVAPGSYSFTVRGKATGQSDQTGTVSLTITAAPAAPAIALALSPTSGSVQQGASGSITATVTRTNFTGAVTIAVSGAPAGVTTSVSQSGDAASITVNVAAGAATGASTLTVTASGSGVTTQSATYALTVTAAPPPASIALALSTTAASIAQGAGGSFTATVTRTNFTGAVTVGVSGAPTGVTTSVAASGDVSTVTVTVGASVAVGTYPLTVTASGTGVGNATATYTLTVTAAPVASSIALTASPTSGSVQQGASGNFGVTIARTNFTGAVTLAVSGAPAGVSASIPASPTTGTSATVTLTVGASVTPGTYPLTVTGSGTGVSNATATYTLTVTSAPVSGGNVTWSFGFCGTGDIPVWVAAQDGSGPWARVTGSGNAYSFNITTKGGIAYVRQTAANKFDLQIFYGSLAELQQQGSIICPSAATKTVNGSVANVGATGQAFVSMGGASAVIAGATGSTFTLTGVNPGAVDLVAARVALNLTTFTFGTDKLIFRRALTPAAGSTLPVLDFNAAEAFAPDTRTATITNGLGENLSLTSLYITGSQSSALLGTDLPSASTSRTIVGVPAVKQVAGDFHVATAVAQTGSASAQSIRTATVLFTTLANQTLALGPALATSTVTTAAASPNTRPRLQMAQQPEYNKLWAVGYSQALAGGGTAAVTVQITAAYQGTAAIDHTVPDFSTVSGWLTSYGLQPSVGVNFSISASGWTTGGGAAYPIADGSSVKTAQRVNVLPPQ